MYTNSGHNYEGSCLYNLNIIQCIPTSSQEQSSVNLYLITITYYYTYILVYHSMYVFVDAMRYSQAIYRPCAFICIELILFIL